MCMLFFCYPYMYIFKERSGDKVEKTLINVISTKQIEVSFLSV